MFCFMDRGDLENRNLCLQRTELQVGPTALRALAKSPSPCRGIQVVQVAELKRSSNAFLTNLKH